jgi:hypothetical protein
VTPRFSDAWVVTGGLGLNLEWVPIDCSVNYVFVAERRAYANTIGGSVEVFSIGANFKL